MTTRFQRIEIDGSAIVVRSLVSPELFAEVTGQAMESTARSYESKVVRLLERIQRRRVGRLVLSSLRTAPKVATILPLERQMSGASARVNDVEGSMAPGHVYFTEQREVLIGAGGGCDVAIYFTPGRCGPRPGLRLGANGLAVSSESPGLRAVPADQPDAVLFHELFHAQRQARGLQRSRPLGDGFHNTEEFLAVVVSNLYLSEGGATVLRANHERSTPLRNPTGFARNNSYQQLLIQATREQPAFFNRLAEFRGIAFNPFAHLS